MKCVHVGLWDVLGGIVEVLIVFGGIGVAAFAVCAVVAIIWDATRGPTL